MRKSMFVVMLACVAILAVPTGANAVTPNKGVGRDGEVPAKWDLPKPRAKVHPDDAPASAGGDGTGYNRLSFSAFDTGDIVVTQGGATGHAGEFDDARHFSDSSYCVWSANVKPVSSVQRETPLKYRSYDQAFGLWVPCVAQTVRNRALGYCAAQNGEPYSITSSKSDQSKWYCSKLVWASYRFIAGLDLDADGGYWVWPIDLINDSQTSLFAYSR